MSEIITKLAQEFRTRLILAHPGIVKRLRPGLPRKEATALAARYGVTLTEEALAFFSVLDGFDNPYRMPQGEVQVFPPRWLDSLESALKHYKEFWVEPDMLLYSEFHEEGGGAMPPLRIIGEDSSYFYALELEAEGRPIWDMQREMGLSIAFPSLEVMLKMLNAWLENKVLIYEYDGWTFTR